MTMAFGGQLYPSQYLAPLDKASKTTALNIALRVSFPPTPTYTWDIPEKGLTPTIFVTDYTTSRITPRFDPAQLHSFIAMGNTPSTVMDSLVEGSNCTSPASAHGNIATDKAGDALPVALGRAAFPT